MDIAESYKTLYSFINTVIDRFINGEYFVNIKGKKGNKTIKGKKVKNKSKDNIVIFDFIFSHY